jgi:hypothetical protein
VFSGAEEVVEAEDGHVDNAVPFVSGVVFGNWEREEGAQDGDIDGEDSVWRRICSGKGREELREVKGELPGADIFGGGGLLPHQVDDLLPHGREVRRYCASCDGFTAGFGVKLSSAEPEGEDLEEGSRVLDPSEIVG